MAIPLNREQRRKMKKDLKKKGTMTDKQIDEYIDFLVHGPDPRDAGLLASGKKATLDVEGLKNSEWWDKIEAIDKAWILAHKDSVLTIAHNSLEDNPAYEEDGHSLISFEEDTGPNKRQFYSNFVLPVSADYTILDTSPSHVSKAETEANKILLSD